MDFTREPIIETVITPKEGCKIVVRSSKNAGQEEYFVDAVEVVSFGKALFFRSLERPKSFLVPATDYEILEVREARMVLKNVGLDRSIKIGGGREAAIKPPKEPILEKEMSNAEEEVEGAVSSEDGRASAAEQKQEGRGDKKRDRRRHYRRRRGREETAKDEEWTGDSSGASEEERTEEKISLPVPYKSSDFDERVSQEPIINTPSIITTLLPPPPTLISETIAKYKTNEMFKGAFYDKEEHKKALENDGEVEEPQIQIEEPHFAAFEIFETPAIEHSSEASVKQENMPLEESAPLEESMPLDDKIELEQKTTSLKETKQLEEGEDKPSDESEGNPMDESLQRPFSNDHYL